MMRRALVSALFGLLLPSFASAQANDVGLAAQPGTPAVPSPHAAAGAACPPPGGVVASFSGATTQAGHVLRDAIPSVCPSKVFPGVINLATTYNYEAFTYSNISGAGACVTVNFDPATAGASPCGTNAHASAYLNSYDPTNQATNYVGDVGSSVTQPFSFTVPAATNLVLVVTNTNSQAICSFGFDIVNLPCSTEADLALTKSVAPTTVAPGDSAVFTLTATNNGPGAAANTVVTDVLPPGLTYVGNDCGAGFVAPNLTWNAGTLAVAFSAICHVTVTVAPGSHTNNASATADGTDTVPANNDAAATVTGQPSIVEVPTLSTAGLAAMLLGLGSAAIRVLRRS